MQRWSLSYLGQMATRQERQVAVDAALPADAPFFPSSPIWGTLCVRPPFRPWVPGIGPAQ